MMIIENEIPDEDDWDFYIGQVESQNETRIRFDHFDGLGKWDPEAAVIPFETISFIQVRTPYINTFRKYLDEYKRGNPGLRSES